MVDQMPIKKEWSVLSPDPKKVSDLSSALGCHPAVARALINRGISTAEQAAFFLKPSLARIRSPFSMKDMDRAVGRILLALERGEKVAIFGDYDADGITSTAILFGFLTELGMDVTYHIPNRLTEGYGLKPDYVKNHALPGGVRLIITVDCGISSHEGVSAARNAGIDVIITDHHEIPPVLPEAFAILNPKQPDCPSGFTWLAGVGVAFHLLLALRKRLRDEHFWSSKGRPEPNLKSACDLVALGTVADMVPLLEENRIYVKTGLKVLATAARPGIRALLDVCNITEGPLNTYDLAFRLAPRLNVSGRLSDGSLAFELLTTSEAETAHAIAKELDRENERRQQLEAKILSDIFEHLDNNPQLLEKRSLVLDREGWHEGVIGIVASRLVRRYMRPVVIITTSNGIGKGSARTPEGLDLFNALKECANSLQEFGGHKTAAGLSLKAENIPVFKRDFERIVCENTPAEGLAPKLTVDGEISPGEITPKLTDELEQLAPFGEANPEPLFLLSDLDVLFSRKVGNSHTQMRLRPSGKVQAAPLDAILFNSYVNAMQANRFDRIACHVRWNRWKNRKKIQLVVRDFVIG